ncbi:MAG: hypothetical protein RLY87_612 [Chloroflexota bacterium]|jgi:ComF family protein
MFERLLQWIFPDVCLGCGKSGTLLCALCLRIAPRYNASPPVTGAQQMYIGFVYTGLVREALLLLKYCGQRRYAALFAQVLAPVLQHTYRAVVPLPAAPSRVQKRGYDQAVLLAAEVSSVHGIPCMQHLVRVRDTTAQAHLDRQQRQHNVAQAFAWNGPMMDGRILLVDDICTTGATLTEAIRTLHQSGLADVDVLVVARGNTKPSHS